MMLSKTALLFAGIAAVSAFHLPEAKRQTCSQASAADLAAAQAAFKAEEVDPDVVQNFDPVSTLSVSYPAGAVQLGNEFDLLQTIPSPDFSFTAEPGQNAQTTKYTLIMVDPDAPEPTAPLLRYFLHYIVSDAQADCVASQNRKVVAPYMFPTPLSIAAHRYTFLIYRQPPNYEAPVIPQNLPGARANFDLDNYIQQAGLIGPPIAGNFYLNGLQQLVDDTPALQQLGASQVVEQVGYVIGNLTQPLGDTALQVSQATRQLTSGLNNLVDDILGGILG